MLRHLLSRASFRPNQQQLSIFTRSSSDLGAPPVMTPDSREESPIPVYKERASEKPSEKRSRLLYQSRKRGILENGLLLSTFADKYLNGFDEEQLKQYDRLINVPTNDWEIYYWATGVRPVPQQFDNAIMSLLKEHTKNTDRQIRNQLPELKPVAR